MFTNLDEGLYFGVPRASTIAAAAAATSSSAEAMN